jgi:exonuclease-1
MGIYGLLKNLKKCIKEKNLEEYRGQRAAVDTYAWYSLLRAGRLHKIIKRRSGQEIVLGKDSKKYVMDCIHRAEKIMKAGIDLTLVFDGGVLPRKQKEEEVRLK